MPSHCPLILLLWRPLWFLSWTCILTLEHRRHNDCYHCMSSSAGAAQCRGCRWAGSVPDGGLALSACCSLACCRWSVLSDGRFPCCPPESRSQSLRFPLLFLCSPRLHGAPRAAYLHVAPGNIFSSAASLAPDRFLQPPALLLALAPFRLFS